MSMDAQYIYAQYWKIYVMGYISISVNLLLTNRANDIMPNCIN